MMIHRLAPKHAGQDGATRPPQRLRRLSVAADMSEQNSSGLNRMKFHENDHLKRHNDDCCTATTSNGIHS